MFFIYVLYSDKFDKFYVGLAQNITSRLNQHNEGLNKSTRPFIPWRLVYSENYKTRMAARLREKYLKSAAGRRWRKNNINLGD